MVLDEKRGKINAKGTKCLFFGDCKGNKNYMLIYLETKMIIKNIDVMFIEDSMSVGNNLEIRLDGRNEGFMVVVEDKFFQSSSCDDGEEQVGDHLVGNE